MPTGAGELTAMGGVSWAGRAANPQAQGLSKGPGDGGGGTAGLEAPDLQNCTEKPEIYFVKVP